MLAFYHNLSSSLRKAKKNIHLTDVMIEFLLGVHGVADQMAVIAGC